MAGRSQRRRRGVRRSGAGQPGATSRNPFNLADIAVVPRLVADPIGAFGGLWAVAHLVAMLECQPARRDLRSRLGPAGDISLKTPSSSTARSARRKSPAAAEAGSSTPHRRRSRRAQFRAATKILRAKAVVSMTRSSACEFGPHGISCNAISPGHIDTPMQRIDNPPEVVPASKHACPNPAHGPPVEVRRHGGVLASVHATFVHEATVNVGGRSVMY